MIIQYPALNPVAFSLGPLAVRWYGLCYLVSFVLLGMCLKRRLADLPGMTEALLGDLLFYGMLGVIFGGRLGYITFYHFAWWWQDPLFVLRLWEPGMSFHGGLLGVLFALWFFGRRHGYSLLAIGDFIAPYVPIGLFLGRLANFVNGELWGRPTESAWGMVFPYVDNLPRHPTQLYEAALEGLLLGLFLIWLSNKRPKTGVLSGAFLAGYGACRFLVEFYREPDVHRGFVALGWLTEGQLLCIPMLLIGFGLCVLSRRKA